MSNDKLHNKNVEIIKEQKREGINRKDSLTFKSEFLICLSDVNT